MNIETPKRDSCLVYQRKERHFSEFVNIEDENRGIVFPIYSLIEKKMFQFVVMPVLAKNHELSFKRSLNYYHLLLNILIRRIEQKPEGFVYSDFLF